MTQAPATPTPLAVDEEVCGDILVTAFDGDYGGCNDWITQEFGAVYKGLTKVVPPGGRDIDGVWHNVGFHVPKVSARRDLEDAAKGPIPERVWDGNTGALIFDHELVRLGVTRILTGECQLRADLRAQVASALIKDEADVDAWAADCIIQAGLFGEVVFS